MSVAAIAYIMRCRCFDFMRVVPLCYGLPEDGEQSTKPVRERQLVLYFTCQCICWNIRFNNIKVKIFWTDLTDEDLYLGCAWFEPRSGYRLS